MEKMCLIYNKENKVCTVRQIKPEEELFCNILKKKEIIINEIPFYNSAQICEKIMGQLSNRNRKLIEMKYGFNGKQMSKKEMANKLNLPEERFNYIYRLAIKEIHKCNIEKYWLNAGYRDTVIMINSIENSDQHNNLVNNPFIYYNYDNQYLFERENRYNVVYKKLMDSLFKNNDSHIENQYFLESENILITIRNENYSILDEKSCYSKVNNSNPIFTHVNISINDFITDIIVPATDEKTIYDVIVKYLLSDEVPYVQLYYLDIPYKLFDLLVSLGYVYVETISNNNDKISNELHDWDYKSNDTLTNLSNFIECCKLSHNNMLNFIMLTSHEYNFICKNFYRESISDDMNISYTVREIIKDYSKINFQKNQGGLPGEEDISIKQKIIEPFCPSYNIDNDLIIEDFSDIDDAEIIEE